MRSLVSSIHPFLRKGIIISLLGLPAASLAQAPDETATGQAVVSDTLAEIHEERAFDRSGYGQNPTSLPLWSPLSNFEIEMVQLLREASTPLSPQQLLHLYLLASGDVRDARQANMFSDQVWTFLERHDDLRAIENEEERGAALLAVLHDELFVEYHEAQSTVSGILETGIYNCISSALVYIVLARELGLEARGVLMPSHAFVEVELADGRKVDVETTAEQGFGMVRDARFFARQAEGWFAARGLEVPSFEDYQRRHTVSARALGLENMWNQHLSPSRASYPLRLRMAEIRGAMQPGNLTAQQNRFVYYYQESDFLRRNDDPALRWQLLSLIEPVLNQFEAETGRAASLQDELRIPLQLLQSARAQWLGSDVEGMAADTRQERRKVALELAAGVLSGLEPGQREYQSIRLDAALAVSDAVQGMMEDQRFQPLPPVLREPLLSQCMQVSTCQQSLDQFHAAWASYHWQQSQWTDAIEVARQYLQWATASPNRAVFEQNMESAYLNQFASLWQQELRDQAYVWLQNCLRLPNASRCEARREEVAPYFQ